MKSIYLILLTIFLKLNTPSQSYGQSILYNTYIVDSNINFLAIGEVHRDVSTYVYEKQILATYFNLHKEDDIVLFLEYSDTLNDNIQRYLSSKDTLDLFKFFQSWSTGSMTNYTFRRYQFLLELLNTFDGNSKIRIVCIDINNKSHKNYAIRDSVMCKNMAKVIFDSPKSTKFIFIAGAAHVTRNYSPKTKNFDNSNSAIKQLRSIAHLYHLNIGTILIQSKYWHSSNNTKKFKTLFYSGFSSAQYEQINTINFKTADYIFIQPRTYLNDTNFDEQDYFLLNKVGFNVGD